MIEVPQEWVLEDRAAATVADFVETMVDLFIADCEEVREATKQMAGELALSHLNLLINQLERCVVIYLFLSFRTLIVTDAWPSSFSLMEHSWTDGHVIRSDPFDYLCATSMGVLRILMERDLKEQFAGDLAQQPDFGSLLVLLAAYVTELPIGPVAHRCKIKLGRIVTRIGDKVALQSVERQRLFANMQSWTSQGLKESGDRNFQNLSNIQQCEDDVTFLNGLAQLSAAMSLDVVAEKQGRSSAKILSDAEFFARFIQRISFETAVRLQPARVNISC